jgi:hypothetical protein
VHDAPGVLFKQKVRVAKGQASKLPQVGHGAQIGPHLGAGGQVDQPVAGAVPPVVEVLHHSPGPRLRPDSNDVAVAVDVVVRVVGHDSSQ